MVTQLIWILIYAIALCLVVYLVFWVLRDFAGIALPDKAEKGIWLIVVLVILAMVVSLLLGSGPFRLGGIINQEVVFHI